MNVVNCFVGYKNQLKSYIQWSFIQNISDVFSKSFKINLESNKN